MLTESQKRIVEIVENRLIHETYYDKDGGTKARGGSYAYAENDGPNPVREIVEAVLNKEISYKNFFEYVKNNFGLYNEPKKMEIVEAILRAIDDDNEFNKIKELT